MALSPDVKRQGREGEDLTPSRDEVQNSGATPPLLPTLRRVVLNYIIKHKDTFSLFSKISGGL
jgi:hypothetical protein